MSGPMSKQQIQDRLLQAPFNAFMGFEVLTADPKKQEVSMRLKMRLEVERRGGFWHGGPLVAAIDVVGDYALAMMVGEPMPTINLRVDYLRPAKGTLTLVGRVRRIGKRVAVVDVEVLNETDEVLALGRVNYSTAQS
jgi:uncharacterized protein (TIGR00369 family)